MFVYELYEYVYSSMAMYCFLDILVVSCIIAFVYIIKIIYIYINEYYIFMLL